MNIKMFFSLLLLISPSTFAGNCDLNTPSCTCIGYGRSCIYDGNINTNSTTGVRTLSFSSTDKCWGLDNWGHNKVSAKNYLGNGQYEIYDVETPSTATIFECQKK